MLDTFNVNQSVAANQSTSNSATQSASQSVKQSATLSVSQTTAQSVSVSHTASQTTAASHTASQSASMTQAVSVSATQSASQSASVSASESQTTSNSLSQSINTDSVSQSVSVSMSTSESASESTSIDSYALSPKNLYGMGQNDRPVQFWDGLRWRDARWQPPYATPNDMSDYIVKEGDELWRIAIDRQCSPGWIKWCSKFSKNELRVGQRLKFTYTPTQFDWMIRYL